MTNDPVHNHPDMAWDMAVPDGWKLVPVEPTGPMLNASKKALTELIMSVPEPERTKRFGTPTERGYQVSGPEKTVARWRAMLAAAPPPPNSKE